MTTKEYNKLMSSNRLWNLMDTNAYRRGLEIQREMTVDDGDHDDDQLTHEQFESRQTGLIIRRKRELY